MDTDKQKHLLRSVTVALTLGQKRAGGQLDAAGGQLLKSTVEDIVTHGPRDVFEAVLRWQAGGMLRLDPRPSLLLDTGIRQDVDGRPVQASALRGRYSVGQ